MGTTPAIELAAPARIERYLNEVSNWLDDRIANLPDTATAMTALLSELEAVNEAIWQLDEDAVNGFEPFTPAVCVASHAVATRADHLEELIGSQWTSPAVRQSALADLLNAGPSVTSDGTYVQFETTERWGSTIVEAFIAAYRVCASSQWATHSSTFGEPHCVVAAPRATWALLRQLSEDTFRAEQTSRLPDPFGDLHRRRYVGDAHELDAATLHDALQLWNPSEEGDVLSQFDIAARAAQRL